MNVYTIAKTSFLRPFTCISHSEFRLRDKPQNWKTHAQGNFPLLLSHTCMNKLPSWSLLKSRPVLRIHLLDLVARPTNGINLKKLFLQNETIPPLVEKWHVKDSKLIVQACHSLHDGGKNMTSWGGQHAFDWETIYSAQLDFSLFPPKHTLQGFNGDHH